MIEVEHLTKCYGDFTALRDLSFKIEDGHVYGFLGPNGAGKSTTMNIMTGCLSATEGRVLIDGYDIFREPKKAKKLIGYLPEQPPLYMGETPLEYLKFVGMAKGLKEPTLSLEIEKAVLKTGIFDVKNKLISSLSKGYKQRVGIAEAILGNPRVIILDEPTVGLDPLQIIEIRDLIKELGREHTVILSSHILSEVQTICEKILIISKGELIAFDTPENLENQMMSGNVINFTADCKEEEARNILNDLGYELENFTKKKDFINADIKVPGEDIYDSSRKLFFAFAKVGKPLLEVNLKKANLEEIFIELTDKSYPLSEEEIKKSEENN